MIKILTVESKHAPFSKTIESRQKEVEDKLEEEIKKLGLNNPPQNK